MLLTSITRALPGILTELAVPRAVILPPSITSTPFSIVPCETVSSLPPLSTTGFVCCTTPLLERIKQTEKHPMKETKPDPQDLTLGIRDLRPDSEDLRPE